VECAITAEWELGNNRASFARRKVRDGAPGVRPPRCCCYRPCFPDVHRPGRILLSLPETHRGPACRRKRVPPRAVRCLCPWSRRRQYPMVCIPINRSPTCSATRSRPRCPMVCIPINPSAISSMTRRRPWRPTACIPINRSPICSAARRRRKQAFLGRRAVIRLWVSPILRPVNPPMGHHNQWPERRRRSPQRHRRRPRRTACTPINRSAISSISSRSRLLACAGWPRRRHCGR
jgi:hypothetical protein